MSDRGQVTPLFALILVMMALGLALIVGTVRTEQAGLAAQTAADAAALAGAAEGRAAAVAIAQANDAELVEFRVAGADTQVVVRVGRRTAMATARRAWGSDDHYP